MSKQAVHQKHAARAAAPEKPTARAVALGVEATPTVLVAGSAVRPEPRPIEAAVEKAARAG